MLFLTMRYIVLCALVLLTGPLVFTRAKNTGYHVLWVKIPLKLRILFDTKKTRKQENLEFPEEVPCRLSSEYIISGTDSLGYREDDRGKRRM
jgi:hypothetical protein